MRKHIYVGLLLLATAMFLTVGAFAQESTVKGNLAGVVSDTTGAVVPGAKVTIEGAVGTKTVDTDNEGRFYFPLVVPGYYKVKVEKVNFKTTNVDRVEVLTGRTA